MVLNDKQVKCEKSHVQNDPWVPRAHVPDYKDVCVCLVVKQKVQHLFLPPLSIGSVSDSRPLFIRMRCFFTHCYEN